MTRAYFSATPLRSLTTQLRLNLVTVKISLPMICRTYLSLSMHASCRSRAI
jgi:hypothetical protein